MKMKGGSPRKASGKGGNPKAKARPGKKPCKKDPARQY